MPERNPPLFDDIVSWIAWRTDEPLTIVYISTSDVRHRVQYLAVTHMIPHKYISILQEDFKWQEATPNSIVFIEGQSEGKDTPLPEPPSTFTNHAVYTNPEGNMIGNAWSNTDVELQPKFSSEISTDCL